MQQKSNAKFQHVTGQLGQQLRGINKKGFLIGIMHNSKTSVWILTVGNPLVKQCISNQITPLAKCQQISSTTIKSDLILSIKHW